MKTAQTKTNRQTCIVWIIRNGALISDQSWENMSWAIFNLDPFQVKS